MDGGRSEADAAVSAVADYKINENGETDKMIIIIKKKNGMRFVFIRAAAESNPQRTTTTNGNQTKTSEIK